MRDVLHPIYFCFYDVSWNDNKHLHALISEENKMFQTPQLRRNK